jgi:dienelactone hydrolase
MVTLNFSDDSGQMGGQIEVLDGDSQLLSAIALVQSSAHFEWTPTDTVAGGSNPIVFDGQVNGHMIVGHVVNGAETGDFTFVRSAGSSPNTDAQFAGTYRFESGRAVGFYETPGAQSQVFATVLIYADLQTGELGAVFPVSGDTFAVGPAVGLAYPFRGEVTFTRNTSGEVVGLVWNQAGMQTATAGKVPIDIEEITYASSGITLAGRLASPATPGKRPAIVIVHGAGKVTRRNWLVDLLDGFFAVHGISTLSYDKRGVGDSGGDYPDGVATSQNIETLGGDALASIAYLKTRSDIDPAQIGLQGASQAGWIIPFAAAQSKDVAFMLIWSGPGVTQGISDMYDSLAETTERSEITRTLQETDPFGFDPIPYLKQTASPGFWAYGGSDMTVPVPESIANLEKVKTEGQKDFTWHTFSGADHYLFVVKSATGDDLRLSPGYPANLFDQMAKWLYTHVH